MRKLAVAAALASSSMLTVATCIESPTRPARGHTREEYEQKDKSC